MKLFPLAAAAIFAAAPALVYGQQAAPVAKPAADKPVATATAQKPAAQKPSTQKTTKAAVRAKFTPQQIKDAQTGLQKQKLYTGKITGVWNAATVKAYKAWQKANNLPEDGVLTEDALAKLKA